VIASRSGGIFIRKIRAKIPRSRLKSQGGKLNGARCDVSSVRFPSHDTVDGVIDSDDTDERDPHAPGTRAADVHAWAKSRNEGEVSPAVNRREEPSTTRARSFRRGPGRNTS